MRVNVYEEELTDEVTLVSTTAETGKVFYGVRFYLKSAIALHHTEEDDDRSAVTFWCGTKADTEDFLTVALHKIAEQK